MFNKDEARINIQNRINNKIKKTKSNPIPNYN